MTDTVKRKDSKLNITRVLQNPPISNLFLGDRVGSCRTFSIPALFCCYISLRSPEFQAFHQMFDPGCSDLLPFSHKSIYEVQHWCRVVSSLARSRCSGSSQRCWMALRPGFWAGQSSTSTPDWENQFFTDLVLWELNQTFFSKSWKNTV